MTRILLFNVKHSPNLGDGLLTECLEGALAAQADDVEVTSIDLAMRGDYGEGGRHRRTMLSILQHLPAAVRRRLAGVVLGAVSRRLRRHARPALAGADAAVVGGGNLFADADLNFPMKIHAVMAEAAAAQVPVSVFGVGVSDNWSARGRRLLRAAMTGVRLVHVAVRDERSRTIWARELESEGVRPAMLCRDPGLLVAQRYPVTPAPAPAPAGTIVGLCLTDPLALRYHGGRADRRLDGWLVALATAMVGAGWSVRLFTNGSPEDRDYLDRMRPRFAEACGARLSVEPAFAVPEDLARFIAGCSLVVAHRMHACIAAYGYRVPPIGLSWDPKLDSFFASVDREGYMIDPTLVSPGEAMAAAVRTLAEGIAPADHARVVAEAADDVARLYASVIGHPR